MPGQPWPSLALILASTCCLPEDVKRNLPVLLLQTWKLALMEGSVRWNRVFCLAHRSEVKCKYNSAKQWFNFSSSFPPLLELRVKRTSDLQSSYLNGNQHVLQGVSQGLCSSSPLCADSCSARLQHSTATAGLFYASRNQAPRIRMPRR